MIQADPSKCMPVANLSAIHVMLVLKARRMQELRELVTSTEVSKENMGGEAVSSGPHRVLHGAVSETKVAVENLEGRSDNKMEHPPRKLQETWTDHPRGLVGSNQQSKGEGLLKPLGVQGPQGCVLNV